MNIQSSLLFINLLWVLNISAEPLVTISQGTLNGTVQIARYGKKYSAFLGIPYAKPPIGNRRFKNPEPAASWKGIRQADSFGNVCPQPKNNLTSGKDDCLFLNIYSPFLNFDKPVPNEKLVPVMIWIHGGSFFVGSGNIYGAQYLLCKNVILVTLNYRLGILGFLTTGDSVAPGNFGLKDQVQALKWIRKNIRSFGGDPEKVTLFGDSAGGVSVNLHSISEASNGLFQKYIFHSGTVLGPGAYQDQKDFQIHVEDLAKKFNCPVNSSQTIVNCLRKVNSEDLVKTTSAAETFFKYGHFLWTPTVEPNTTDAFLTENPLNSVNNNKMKDLIYMCGTCADDGLSFTNGAYSNEYIYTLLRSNIKTLINHLVHYNKHDSEKLFLAIDEFYFNNNFNTSTKTEFLNKITNFLGDAVYFYPLLRILEKATPRMKNYNYFYNFGYRGSVSLTNFYGNKENQKVSHGDDILYLFPLSHDSFVTSNANFTSDDEKISRIMVDLWTSFAANGCEIIVPKTLVYVNIIINIHHSRKPTSSELPKPNLWQPYSPKSTSHIQIGNKANNRDPNVSMSSSYFTDRINFWRKHVPV